MKGCLCLRQKPHRTAAQVHTYKAGSDSIDPNLNYPSTPANPPPKQQERLSSSQAVPLDHEILKKIKYIHGKMAKTKEPFEFEFEYPDTLYTVRLRMAPVPFPSRMCNAAR
jgi:hypothetical protein